MANLGDECAYPFAECALGKLSVFHLFYYVGEGAGFNCPPSASQTVGINALTKTNTT
ncbi:MAG: hypothetical protein ACKO96_16255 [Flammeovirgaceae bacterium]